MTTVPPWDRAGRKPGTPTLRAIAAGDPPPHLDEARCAPGGSFLPSSAWDGDAPPELHEAAIGHCGTCPVLTACGAWLDSLPQDQRLTGVIAGRSIAWRWRAPPKRKRKPKPREFLAMPDGSLQPVVTAAGELVPVLVVHAGLASATGTAPGASVRLTRYGRDLAKRQRSNAAYRASHRDEIAEQRHARYAANKARLNEARRQRRQQPDREARLAADRVRYWQRRDEIVERRRQRRKVFPRLPGVPHGT